MSDSSNNGNNKEKKENIPGSVLFFRRQKISVSALERGPVQFGRFTVKLEPENVKASYTPIASIPTNGPIIEKSGILISKSGRKFKIVEEVSNPDYWANVNTKVESLHKDFGSTMDKLQTAGERKLLKEKVCLLCEKVFQNLTQKFPADKDKRKELEKSALLSELLANFLEKIHTKLGLKISFNDDYNPNPNPTAGPQQTPGPM